MTSPNTYDRPHHSTSFKISLALLTLGISLLALCSDVRAQQVSTASHSTAQEGIEQTQRRPMLVPTAGLRLSPGGKRIDSLFEEGLSAPSLHFGAALYPRQKQGPYVAFLGERQSYKVFDGRKAVFWMPVMRLGWSLAPMWENETSDLGRAYGRINLYGMVSFRPRSLSRGARMRAGVGLHIPAFLMAGGCMNNLEVSTEWGANRPAAWFVSYGWSL